MADFVPISQVIDTVLSAIADSSIDELLKKIEEVRRSERERILGELNITIE